MHTRNNSLRFHLLLSLILLPNVLQAHPGHFVSDFFSGAAHPMMGLDHICAMVAVGIWAAQLGGRALWAMPSAFLGAVLFGGILGTSGMHLPQVELGIALSVLILGLLISSSMRTATWLGAALVSVFAVFHGYAHATEMPVNVSSLTFDFGFLTTTALLHLIGMGLGLMVARVEKNHLARLAGAAIAVCGVALLAT